MISPSKYAVAGVAHFGSMSILLSLSHLATVDKSVIVLGIGGDSWFILGLRDVNRCMYEQTTGFVLVSSILSVSF